jgi:hypothetical protein
MALSKHPVDAHGIAYYARHDDEQLCYALYDRAVGAVVEADRAIDLDQDWFWRLASRYKLGVAPDYMSQQARCRHQSISAKISSYRHFRRNSW